MGVVIVKVIQAIQATPHKITAVKTTVESFVCHGRMGLVDDVPSPMNRKGISRSGHLQSPCCLSSVDMEEVMLTLWKDSEQQPSEKGALLVISYCRQHSGWAPQQ